MQTFHDKLIEVRDRVQQASERAHRLPNSVKILAVSKTQPASRIREAVAAGQTCFGENYLQEALVKQTELKQTEIKQTGLQDQNIEWHFIGPIQSNKTRAIAEHFDWVHSIDRFKIAQRLSEHRPQQLPPLTVCIQVNLDDEASKSGVPAKDLPALAAAVINLPRLQLTGLMAIPLPRAEYREQLAAFLRVAELNQSLEQKLGRSLPTLSMGMSGDLEAAIAAGSTLVRIGTDLFGPRLEKPQAE